ncbi:MAG: SBBP repeat-containing protein [Terriglobales bacterium]
MRPLRFVSLFTTLLITSLFSTLVLAQSSPVLPSKQPIAAKNATPSGLSQPNAASQAKIVEKYGKLPLSFEANQGQTDSRVKFLSRTGSYSLFLTGDEAVLELSGKTNRGKTNIDKTKLDKAKVASTAHTQSGMTETKAGGVLRMKLRNANGAAKITGMDELAGTSNYFIGNDSAKWQTNVPTYAKVKYEGIYSGIDLVYYGNQRQLEYDFIVAPGADPHRIAFDVSGAQRIRQNAQGELVFKMKTGEDEIRWHKPVVYQEKNGTRQEIAARYSITVANRVGFELAKYDASRPLYIDPLIYSTYLGGSGQEYRGGIAVDSTGNAYIVGSTLSTDFPTMNPLQPTIGGANVINVFVSKINAGGTAFAYSTYLGGSGTPSMGQTAGDTGNGIAVDGNGNAYVTGTTCSKNFPTVNPIQPANAGGNPFCDGFVAKINPSGTALTYSTYLGGSEVDSGLSVAVDSAGNAYVTGNTFSADFPTMNPLQPANGGGANNESAFVTKINSAGSALAYSTYLGGSASDSGWGIAVDSAGDAYVAGANGSTDFPTKNPLQPQPRSMFVSELNQDGSAFVYSTYLGGSGQDFAYGIALDGAGSAYVTGYTFSNDFPTTPGAFQTVCGGGSCSSYVDAFVTKIAPSGGALVYSTYLGGSSGDVGNAIAVDSAGSAYVIGGTSSKDFPKKNPLPGQSIATAFVTKLNTTGSALVYSTYLGGRTASGDGIAVDGAGSAYGTGITGKDFPTVNALQPTYGGGNTDAFVAKIHIAAASTTTLSSSPNPSTYGQEVTFTAVVSSGDGAPADGETVAFVQAKNTLGTGVLHGGSASFTTSALSLGHHPIKAVYGGDSNFLGSSSKSLTQVVDKAAE